MAVGDALTKQILSAAYANQDIDLQVTCYQSDGTTLRDMTGGDYKMTFYAESTKSESVTITKTSAAGEIVFGSPDDNGVTITILNTDLTEAGFSGGTMEWILSGTDTSDDNQFVAACGEMAVPECP